MRLVFKKLRTPASTIKVSFDGETYRTYDVNTIKNQGYIEFTEQDCPDLTKLKIQGQFSTIDSVEVNKNILIEGTTEGLLCNYEAEVFNHIHYNCYTYDDNNNNLPDESIDESWHIWVNANNENDVVACEDEGMPSSSNELVPLTTFNPHGIFFIDDTHDTLICPILSYQRYPNGDINGEDYHYYCFIKSNIINNPGSISSEYCVWLKDEISETAEVYKMYNTSQSGLCLDVAELSIYAEPNYINLIREVNNIIYFDSINPSDQDYFLRDPNGDIDMRRGSGEVEPASDIITEIQEEPTITENGKYYAEDGKAFKSVNVNISSALYKYNIISKENQDTVIAFSTVRKDQLGIGDPILVLTNQGVLNPVYIRADDYNTYTFPYISKVSINEIIQEAAGEIIESPK